MKDYGGPAFPVNEKNADGTHWQTHMGMSLRDYFATKAMQAIITGNSDRYGCNVLNADAVAINAYKISDAMIEMRKL